MSSDFALIVSVALVSTVVVALFSKSVSLSLIMLFYSSLLLGILFSFYGATLVGVIHIITFAGAVSVMLLTVVLITGEDSVGLGSMSRSKLFLFLIAVMIPVIGTFVLLAASPAFGLVQSPSIPTSDLFGFIWTFRPWDMIILVMVFSSALVAVVNLLSKESTESRQ